MDNKDNKKKPEEPKDEQVKDKKPENKAEALKHNLSEAEKKIKSLEEENAALNDKHLRLAAEYENFRRRSAKERSELFTDALAEAVGAFLPAVDNARLAVAYATGDGELEKGMRLLDKQLGDILAKINVEEIADDGKPFNPDYHNAIVHEEEEGAPENTVKETLQKGYRIGERVIRHALVKVVN